MEKANIDNYDKIDNIEFDISSKKLMLIKGVLSFHYDKVDYGKYSQLAEKAYVKFPKETYEEGWGAYCEYYAIDDANEVLNLVNSVLNETKLLYYAKLELLYGEKLIKVICRNNGDIEIYRSKFNL